MSTPNIDETRWSDAVKHTQDIKQYLQSKNIDEITAFMSCLMLASAITKAYEFDQSTSVDFYKFLVESISKADSTPTSIQ
jgi:hypothetical protein